MARKRVGNAARMTVVACGECGKLTRPQHTTKTDFPGTVARGARGRCQTCANRKIRGGSGGQRRLSQVEQAALSLELRTLNEWEIEAARRVVRYDSEIMKLLGISEEVST